MKDLILIALGAGAMYFIMRNKTPKLQEPLKQYSQPIGPQQMTSGEYIIDPNEMFQDIEFY